MLLLVVAIRESGKVSPVYLMMTCVHYWRASETSETLSGVYKFELVRYIYVYIYICMEVRVA